MSQGSPWIIRIVAVVWRPYISMGHTLAGRIGEGVVQVGKYIPICTWLIVEGACKMSALGRKPTKTQTKLVKRVLLVSPALTGTT